MKSIAMIVVILFIFLLPLNGALYSEELDSGALYALIARDIGSNDDDRSTNSYATKNELVVIDPSNRTIAANIELTSGQADGIYPTPGGKFIFVTLRDSADIAIVDFETRSQSGQISILNKEPARLTFTPRGEELYVSYQSGEDIDIFSHRRAALTYRAAVSLGDHNGNIGFNRRATRIYQGEESGLVYYLRKDHSVIRRVKQNTSAANLAIGPNFRYIWSVSDNRLSIVDERRGRVKTNIEGSFAPEPPLFFNSSAYLLNGDRDTVLVYGDARFNLKDEIELGEQASGIAIDQQGTLWFSSANNNNLAPIDIENPDKRGDRILLPGAVLELRYIRLRSGEGFACF